MTKTSFAFLSAAFLNAALVAPATTIDLPQYGFTIDALDSKPGSTAVTALMTFLPPTEDFAPNVNVNIQPFAKGLEDYITLSKGQFKSMKWTIVAEKQVGENEWSVEYKGPMDGKNMHFYSRALVKGETVYLVTATSLESQWKDVGAKLREHADTFKTK